MQRIVCAKCAVLLLLAVSSASPAAADEAASLAEQAIVARYAAETLAYEKHMAERTVKQAETIIKDSAKSLPELKAAIEKGDKKRDPAMLKRLEERVAKAEVDLAAARELVPLKDTAAKEAFAKAGRLHDRALAADLKRAAARDPQTVARRIDAIIDARLKSAGHRASPAADDAEFLRRATLDVTGIVPKYEDVLAFLGDNAGDKRAALVDRLLADAAYGRNFAQRFCTVTTENGTSTLNQARDYFSAWLAESLNLNRGWDRVTTDMLAADGVGYASPGALFTVAYRMNEQPDPALLVGAAGDYFLGLQIQCVQCHNHPYHADWHHEDFWSLAAMFGRVRVKGSIQNVRELEFVVTDHDVDPKEMLRMNGIQYPDQLSGGKIAIPDPVNAGKTLETVSAKFLDGGVPELPEKGNYRRDFARWLTAKENPYFARATVNRLWAHFFGRGIVEPILNLHPDNAPSHPDLLDLLAAEFKESGYDLKHLIRCITASRTYQRSSKSVAGTNDDPSLFAHMAVKPLDSYVLLDSLAAVLRRPVATGTRRRDEAAVFDTRIPGSDPTKYTHSIPQVLKLMNTKDHAEMNSAVQTATRDKSPAEAIEHLYLAVLARRPTSDESAEILAYVKELGDPRQGYADVFWVLLNGAEFLVNH